MHKVDDIEIEQVSKIEGHADLKVKIRNGKVEDTQLQITENKRFYTQAVRGKSVNNIAQVVSRICGTCSIAHNTCCIEAVEKAYGIQPSPQTLLMRNLTMNGLMIRDHALHLYLFCLPDIFGTDSVLEFKGKDHKYLHDAFDVKKVGNNLCTHIAGRAVHPTLPQVGGFLKVPKKEELKQSVKEMEGIRNKILDLIDVFYKCDFKFETDRHFIALTNDDYNFIRGSVCSSEGHCIPEEDYWDHLERKIIPYSQATGFTFEGEPFMVGAISRMNLNKKALHKDTKKDAAKALNVFPSNNVYHNNLAQAIEILHCIDKSTELIETSEFKVDPRPPITHKQATGVGVIEAPRGTLYYMLSLKPDGTIGYGNLVIPSGQNQIMMGLDIKHLVEPILDKERPFVEHEIEKLIRAYDPCMSCAAHFLKVKWDEK